MLCSELFEFLLTEGKPIEVGDTTVIVNPWPSDVARMLTKDSILRALSEPGRFVIWPAEEVLHQPVQNALHMDRRARRYIMFGSDNNNDRATVKVGRFHVWMTDSANTIVKPPHMSAEIRTAFGIR